MGTDPIGSAGASSIPAALESVAAAEESPVQSGTVPEHPDGLDNGSAPPGSLLVDREPWFQVGPVDGAPGEAALQTFSLPVALDEEDGFVALGGAVGADFRRLEVFAGEAGRYRIRLSGHSGTLSLHADQPNGQQLLRLLHGTDPHYIDGLREIVEAIISTPAPGEVAERPWGGVSDEPAPERLRIRGLEDRRLQIDLPAGTAGGAADPEAWARVIIGPEATEAYEITADRALPSRAPFALARTAVELARRHIEQVPEWHPLRAEQDAFAAVSKENPVAFVSSSWEPGVETTHIAVSPAALPSDILESLLEYAEPPDAPLGFELRLSDEGRLRLTVSPQTRELLHQLLGSGFIPNDELEMAETLDGIASAGFDDFILWTHQQRTIALLAQGNLSAADLADAHPALAEFALVQGGDQAFLDRGLPTDPAERIVYRARVAEGYRAEWDRATSTFGHRPLRYIGYLDNLREKPIVDTLLAAAERTDEDPAFLYTVGMGEGLVLELDDWTDSISGVDVPEEIDGFGALGIDFFGTEVEELRTRGWLPDAFQEGTHYRLREAVNEKDEEVMSASILASPDGASSLYNAFVALAAVIRSREAQARAVLGRDFVNDTERNFATYYTFNAGAGVFRDYLRSGPVVRPYAGEELSGPSQNALANTAARMATWQHLSRVVFND